jgi:hypothetical protein
MLLGVMSSARRVALRVSEAGGAGSSASASDWTPRPGLSLPRPTAGTTKFPLSGNAHRLTWVVCHDVGLIMKIRKLTKAQVEGRPYEVWNAFVNLLWMERYEDLCPEQRAAQLVIKYEGEVQNGGHLQYFENGRGERLDETIAALGVLGATCQQQVLREAAALWRGHARPRIQGAQQFCETALEGEFSELDQRFYACTPSLERHLESHLNQNRSRYVSVE